MKITCCCEYFSVLNGTQYSYLFLTFMNNIPYKRKFSRGSNFRYFRERSENAKICLREKLYFKRKFRSRYWCDILLHTLPYEKKLYGTYLSKLYVKYRGHIIVKYMSHICILNVNEIEDI